MASSSSGAGAGNYSGAPGPGAPAHMFDEEGAYQWNRREGEGKDYQHSYDYFGGFLGADAVEEKRKKEKLKGKLHLEVVLPNGVGCALNVVTGATATTEEKGMDANRQQIIEKVALNIHKAQDSDYTESNFYVRDGKRFRFLKEHEPHECSELERLERRFYLFLRHCHEREVDPATAIAKQRVIAADRDAKTRKMLADGVVAPEQPAAEKMSEEQKKFPPGTRVEVFGLKAKPELNKQIATVKEFVASSGRFKVEFEETRLEIAVKTDNIMLATTQTAPEKAEWKHAVPKEARVTIEKLTGATYLNGSAGTVVGFDSEKGRYNVKLDAQYGGVVKQVKQDNLKCMLPPGWTEHWDEHMAKFYYKSEKTGRIQWKHPVLKATTTKESEKNPFKGGATFDLNEDAEKADFSAGTFAGDNLEKGEGFDLNDLVDKVARDEDRKRRREAGEEVDSDDDEAEAAEKQRKKRRLANNLTKQDKQKLFHHSTLLDNIKLLRKRFATELKQYPTVGTMDIPAVRTKMESSLAQLRNGIEAAVLEERDKLLTML